MTVKLTHIPTAIGCGVRQLWKSVERVFITLKGVPIFTYIAIFLSSLVVTTNLSILIIYMKTWSFGPSITYSTFYNDANIVTAIGLWAKVSEALTITLTGWALTQMWSRDLIQGGTASGFFGLQALNMFSSLGSLFRTIYCLARGRYSPGTWPMSYVPWILSACILQLYPTAITTLAVPIVWSTMHTSSYPISSAPFMSVTPTDLGLFCDRYISDEACLRDHYLWQAAAGALRCQLDDITMSPSVTWRYGNITVGDHNWFVFVGGNRFIFNTILDLYFSDPNGSPIRLAATVPAKIPVLSAQCGTINHQADNRSSISIARTVYEVPIPIPVLETGTIAAQITTDNVTLIITYPSPIESTNVHCALNISMFDSDVSSFYVSLPQTGYGDDAEFKSGVLPDFTWRTLPESVRLYQTPIKDSVDRWLELVGWSATPNLTPISEAVSHFSLGTNYERDNGAPLELCTAQMLIDALSHGFPGPSTNGTSSESLTAEWQSFTYDKEQYYIGARTTTRILSCIVIALDTLIVIWSLLTIIGVERWLPDWSDPVTLACIGIASPCIDVCRKGSGGQLKSEVWKLSLTAVEREDGLFQFQAWKLVLILRSQIIRTIRLKMLT